MRNQKIAGLILARAPFGKSRRFATMFTAECGNVEYNGKTRSRLREGGVKLSSVMAGATVHPRHFTSESLIVALSLPLLSL